MNLTVNGLLDRLAECIYDVVCDMSTHLEEDERRSIALRSEFNGKVTKIPLIFQKSRNDHYNTVILKCEPLQLSVEVICDPKNYCYKDIREWIRSVIASGEIVALQETPELNMLLANSDGQICICALGGVVHVSLRNQKNYLGNRWLKRNFVYRGFTVNPDASDEYCLMCGNYLMTDMQNGHDKLPVIPGIVPDDFGNSAEYEHFSVLK